MSTRGSTIVLFVTLAAGIGCEEAPPTEIPTVELAVIADGEHGGTPFKTRMTQEVTREPQYEGDPHGRGVARLTINVGQREVCWNISAENIVLPATAAHIHRAPAGVRGGIVVFLSPPQTNGRARGCARCSRSCPTTRHSRAGIMP